MRDAVQVHVSSVLYEGYPSFFPVRQCFISLGCDVFELLDAVMGLMMGELRVLKLTCSNFQESDLWSTYPETIA